MKIEQFEKYPQLKMEVRMHEERIDEVFNETQMPAKKPSEGSIRKQGRGERQERANIRYLEIKERLQPLIEANIAEMRKIEDAINSLSDPLEREVLRMRFLDSTDWNPVKWRIVAMRLYGDDDEKDIQAAKRAFRKARENLETLL